MTIKIFQPNPDSIENLVWAVDEEHLPNYLLPRDCPRVAFAAGIHTSKQDAGSFFNDTRAKRIVVVEQDWLPAIMATSLCIYELPDETFALKDNIAGYYVSSSAVFPRSKRVITRGIDEMLERNTELRLVPDLWPICDAVTGSTLEFSAIRMRNAKPRIRT